MWKSRPGKLNWYGPLGSPSLQIASMASEHRNKNHGGPNQWIVRVKITPRLSKIHLSLLINNSRIRILGRVMCKQIA